MCPDTARRKLTTILAADVVGYSALMADDEEATLDTLRAFRDVIDTLIDKHNGRIFNTAGDAIMAEFGSAVEAVRCAISLQEDLRVKNAELAADRQMWFRIGVNVGDVMVDNGDLFGDGVNVAARLEGIAEKGGICISGSTFDQVKNKLSIAFDDIGAQTVKNIPEPVPAYRLVPSGVIVKNDKSPASKWAGLVVGKKNWRRLAAAIAGAVAIAVGVVFTPSLFQKNGAPSARFDGQWRVTLSSLSGCLNNNTRSYRVTVVNGTIDEPLHRFPKKGRISGDGKFYIVAFNESGNQISKQTGSISGDSGKGVLQGWRQGCDGEVALKRVK